jgi:hypothetical protein
MAEDIRARFDGDYKSCATDEDGPTSRWQSDLPWTRSEGAEPVVCCDGTASESTIVEFRRVALTTALIAGKSAFGLPSTFDNARFSFEVRLK